MPYRNKVQLPENVKSNLTLHAQNIYRKAFNSAWDQYNLPSKRRGVASREETAHKVAWGAVKYEYMKENDNWVKK